jgi:UDP-3-O-[3-hydroxymyristoyl] glucosamine N-acyltransferase
VISGLVLIEKNVTIDNNAEIVGPCFIGENTISKEWV